MTVDELIEWLESAKRVAEESGQEIGEYPVVYQSGMQGFIDGGPRSVYYIPDPKVDHGLSTVIL